MDERGQAYSLEGVIGAIVIASALVLALQAVSIEPWTGDGPGQGIETQTQMQDTLDILEDEEALKPIVLTIGGDDERTPHEGVISADPPVEPAGTILNKTAARTTNYNVYVAYPDEDGTINETVVGSELTPTDSAVTVTREVVLFDSDPIYELNETAMAVEATDESLGNPDEEIYLNNQNEDGDIYAVVQIRVVAW